MRAECEPVSLQQPKYRQCLKDSTRGPCSACRSSFDTWQTGFGAVRGISLDISQGGLGAIVEGNLRIGEAVQIDFALEKRKLTTVGIVRDASSERCGFQFLGLNEEERRQIITLADTA
jgi:c-di-GMP-binding flagellar brake protein YcgR